MEEGFQVSELENQLNDGTPYKATDQGGLGKQIQMGKQMVLL